MDPSKVLKEIIKTKEYAKATKCAAKHCLEFKKIMDREKELVHEMGKLAKEMNKSRNFRETILKSNELLGNTVELLELKSKKDALRCFLKDCTEEFIDLSAISNSKMVGMIEKQREQLTEFINKKKK